MNLSGFADKQKEVVFKDQQPDGEIPQETSLKGSLCNYDEFYDHAVFSANIINSTHRNTKYSYVTMDNEDELNYDQPEEV